MGQGWGRTEHLTAHTMWHTVTPYTHTTLSFALCTLPDHTCCAQWAGHLRQASISSTLRLTTLSDSAESLNSEGARRGNYSQTHDANATLQQRQRALIAGTKCNASFSSKQHSGTHNNQCGHQRVKFYTAGLSLDLQRDVPHLPKQ